MLIVIQIYSKKVNDNLPMQTMSTEDKPMMFCLVKCNGNPMLLEKIITNHLKSQRVSRLYLSEAKLCLC